MPSGERPPALTTAWRWGWKSSARVYGVRYVVSFTALAAALPLIAFVYERWGFDTLFRVLAATALAILVTVACLPRTLPAPEPAPAPAPAE